MADKTAQTQSKAERCLVSLEGYEWGHFKARSASERRYLKVEGSSLRKPNPKRQFIGYDRSDTPWPWQGCTPRSLVSITYRLLLAAQPQITHTRRNRRIVIPMQLLAKQKQALMKEYIRAQGWEHLRCQTRPQRSFHTHTGKTSQASY